MAASEHGGVTYAGTVPSTGSQKKLVAPSYAGALVTKFESPQKPRRHQKRLTQVQEVRTFPSFGTGESHRCTDKAGAF